MSPPTSSTVADDYRAARTAAAVVDLSAWTVLHLRGADTRAFLQGLGTQEFEAAGRREAATSRPEAGSPEAEALQTLFLNEKGRPVALAWVAIAGDGTTAWVIADEGARVTLRAHFERFRIMEDVEFEGPDSTPKLTGVVGPARAALLRELAASTAGATVLHSDPISSLLTTTQDINARAPHLTPETFEAWRLATGVPRTGVDIDLDRIATELSLADAISMTKGCYVGQEVVSRTSNRGQVRRRRIGFRFPWTGTPIPARAEIRAGESVVGYVTSSVREPGTNEGLGMGYVTTEPLASGVELAAGEGGVRAPLTFHDWPL